MIDNTQSFQIFNRGPSPVVRLVFFAALSLLLLFVDARYRYLESIRSALSVVISPVQRLAALPGALWQEAGDFYITQSRQHSLIKENDDLQRQHLTDAAQLAQLRSLYAENQQLRNLLALPIRDQFFTQLAEIVYSERDVFRRRVLVNKGAGAKVQVGQVVMDDVGIVGQVTRVYPWLAEVTLITEKDHAVPVQVMRNRLRTIIFGAGDTSQLSLRYLPVNADVQDGDMLVTSGIDGVYPPDIPVARVVKIERDAAYPFARVTCVPVSGVDKHRHLLILSDRPKLPERPEEKQTAASAEKRVKARRKN